MPDAVKVAEAIPGWMSRTELQWLAATAGNLEPGAVWLELGSFCGRSTAAVGQSLPPDSTLLVVDSFDPAFPVHQAPWHHRLECPGRQHDGKHPIEVFAETLAMLKEARQDVTVRLHSMPTSRIPTVLTGVRVDVAFIDAGHQASEIALDCEVCEKVLAWGGLLCGHDYGGTAWPAVRQVVDYRYGKRVKVVPQTTLWYLT